MLSGRKYGGPSEIGLGLCCRQSYECEGARASLQLAGQFVGYKELSGPTLILPATEQRNGQF
jgi:hypothetical protein